MLTTLKIIVKHINIFHIFAIFSELPNEIFRYWALLAANLKAKNNPVCVCDPWSIKLDIYHRNNSVYI